MNKKLTINLRRAIATDNGINTNDLVSLIIKKEGINANKKFKLFTNSDYNNKKETKAIVLKGIKHYYQVEYLNDNYVIYIMKNTLLNKLKIKLFH